MNSLKLVLKNRIYFSVIWIFASLNILIGTWVLYLPYIKHKLKLNDGELGIVLFYFSLGTIVMIFIANPIVRYFGLGRTTYFSLLLFALLFLLPLAITSYLGLCLSLFFVGSFSCLTDITMNALISELEMKDGVHIMSVSHGFFSLGGIIGGGIGSLVIGDIPNPFLHMLLAVIIIIVTNTLLFRHYFKIDSIPLKKEVKFLKKIGLYKPLFVFAIIAFISMGSEGAIEHWSKLYLIDVVQIQSDKLAGMGFVLFSTTMTLGRFFGDGLSKAIHPFKLLIGSFFIAFVGYLLVLSTYFNAVVFGFCLIGLGFSIIVPETFRIAGKNKFISPVDGIAFVSGLGYIGFLISPVILGYLSKLGTLKLSFLVLMIVILLAMFLILIQSKLFNKNHR